MTTNALSFEPVRVEREVETISRPSLSYWQDAWLRLKANTRAIVSLYLVIGLLLFTVFGPVAVAGGFLGPGSGSDQRAAGRRARRHRGGRVPSLGRRDGHTVAGAGGELQAPASLSVAGDATTRAVRLQWSAAPDAGGYRIYRSIFETAPDGALGLPLGGRARPPPR